MFSIPHVRYIKLPQMQQLGREELADFVRRIRREKRLSLADVARRSGNTISRGYINQIENRYIVSVTTKRLDALATGLGISTDEILSVAAGTQSEDKDAARELSEAASVIVQASNRIAKAQTGGEGQIPMYDIAAGQPIDTLGDGGSYPVSEKFITPGKENFAFRIRGTSMIDEGVFDGDVIICYRILDFKTIKEETAVVVDIAERGATYKKWHRCFAGAVVLMPSNQSDRGEVPITCALTDVRGVYAVTGLERKL
jgi:SOS-response transcriptional repressor LexA